MVRTQIESFTIQSIHERATRDVELVVMLNPKMIEGEGSEIGGRMSCHDAGTQDGNEIRHPLTTTPTSDRGHRQYHLSQHH